MKILTISIAAYNVAKYISQALDSFILPQVMNDIEVLIVDDGSKDNTCELVSEYEIKYPDTFRLIKKENGGHGSTINRSLSEAKGKYYKIVDGDDWINGNHFIKLVEHLKEIDDDLVITNFCKVYDGSGKKEYINYFKEIETNKQFDASSFPCIKSLSMHNIAIKTEVLTKHNIIISEKCFYVDLEFKLYSIFLSQTVRFLDLCIYMYRIGLHEQSVNINNMKKNIAMHEKVSLVCLSYYKNEIANANINRSKMVFLKNSIAKIIGDHLRLLTLFSPNAETKSHLMRYDLKVKETDLDIYKISENYFGLLFFIRKTSYNLLSIPHLLLLCKVKISTILKKI